MWNQTHTRLSNMQYVYSRGEREERWGRWWKRMTSSREQNLRFRRKIQAKTVCHFLRSRVGRSNTHCLINCTAVALVLCLLIIYRFIGGTGSVSKEKMIVDSSQTLLGIECLAHGHLPRDLYLMEGEVLLIHFLAPTSASLNRTSLNLLDKR